MQYQAKHKLIKLFLGIISMCVVVIIYKLASSAVEGQGPSMAPYYGSTNFSDEWVDEDGTVHAVVTTQALPNPFNHKSRATATLTSPNGRVASYDTGFCCGYAQSQVSLPFLETDRGLFTLCSQHRNFCPVASINFAEAALCPAETLNFSQPLSFIEAKVTESIKAPLSILGGATLNLGSAQCNGSDFALIVKFKLIDFVNCCYDDNTRVSLQADSIFTLQRFEFNVGSDPKDREAIAFLNRRTGGTTNKVTVRVYGHYPSGETAIRSATVTLACP